MQSLFINNLKTVCKNSVIYFLYSYVLSMASCLFKCICISKVIQEKTLVVKVLIEVAALAFPITESLMKLLRCQMRTDSFLHVNPPHNIKSLS